LQRDVSVLRVPVLCARMQQSRSGSRKMLAGASVANAGQWETMGLGCTKNKHDY
jgi:hypothetical protein